ncbi:hypothetical protein B0T10DRAFT_88481 [Thelonectria olida]|uniref:Uncharacterized protein n=1 Tax=Thelonectria olida TaxID=1576542 RepID=A0A9P8W0U5_9HYPO|nr:hypothetical protein B0T10DRAFT_88481 [Thelonectria olida]
MCPAGGVICDIIPATLSLRWATMQLWTLIQTLAISSLASPWFVSVMGTFRPFQTLRLSRFDRQSVQHISTQAKERDFQ